MEEQTKLKEENKDNDAISKTEEENKRLEEALKKREELLKRQDELNAREKIGGKSEAGKPQKTQQDLENERHQADADRIYYSIYKKK